MTDRELLELAAKASGVLTASWYGNDAYFDGVLSRWNPLSDDGDALRSRLASLESACAERLAAIETLDAEVRRLQAARPWWRSLVGKRGH